MQYLFLLVSTASALQLRLKPTMPPRSTSIHMQYGQQQDYVQQQGYGQQQDYGQGYGGQQMGYGQQVLCRIRPTNGIFADSEYVVRPGEEQSLGRRNTWGDKLTISREQCIVTVDPSGQASLTAIGRPQTGLRNGLNAMWQPLGGMYQRDTRPLQNGDQITLDSNVPDLAVYTVEIMADDGSYQAQQGNYNQQGMGQQGMAQHGMAQQGGLPYGWTSAIDPASGQTYYTNSQTGQCQWEMPY